MHGTFAGDRTEAGKPTPRAHAAVPRFLRSEGTIDLAFERRGTRTTALRTYQAGCLRLRLPRAEHSAEPPCAVLINTAGGVAEDDQLGYRLAWGEGTDAIATTQAAEKVYRALARPSRISTEIAVASGAVAEWLPQETILFDRFQLRRDARVLLAEDASFLGVEALVLGRRASGEVVHTGSLRDALRIWRGGRLVYADALVLGGEIDALMQRSAIGGGALAMAVLVHAAPGAAKMIQPVREALKAAKGRAAASTWNGLLAARLLAPDGETLRHDIAAALGVLRGGRPLPRVWRC
jgi:urease accessory protein